MQIDPLYVCFVAIFLLYLNNLGSVITNDARCAGEIECRTVMAKEALNKKVLFTNKLQLTCNEEASESTHVEQSFVWF